MNNNNPHNNTLVEQCKKQPLLKLITGITNFNLNEISQVIQTAELLKASYIDIAADVNIIKFVKRQTNLPICVSLIDPLKVKDCLYAGTDLLEIGNFNFLYQKDFSFSANKIIKLCDYIRNMVPETVRFIYV